MFYIKKYIAPENSANKYQIDVGIGGKRITILYGDKRGYFNINIIASGNIL